MRRKWAGASSCSWLMVLFFLHLKSSWLGRTTFVEFVLGQGESVSLDCGGDFNFLDTISNVTWVPDNAYISTGSATPSSFSDSGEENKLARELRTSRYFDITTPSKNCYTFVVTPRPYLVRAGFYLPKPDLGTSIFQLALDSTLWALVNITGTSTLYYEAVSAPPTKETLAVCLIRTSDLGSVPFISSLELRPLDPGVYTDSPLFPERKHHMYLANRANFGEQSTTQRWQGDPYDRAWPPYATVASLTMTPNVVNWSVELPEGACSTHNKLPREVMQTAVTASNITYTISGLLPKRLVYGIQYFCELDASSSSERRRTFHWVANFSHIIPDDPPTTVADQVSLDEPFSSTDNGFVIARTGNGATITIELIKDPSSQLDPILNAGEVYYIEPVADSTDDKDGEVLQDLKQVLGLSHWVGDPCLPVPWDELSSPPCTSNVGGPVRVQSLDLSNKNLSGPIPPPIRKLQMLTTLRLNDNRLSGKLPDLNLSRLVILDVSKNNLTGSFPSWLKKQALSTLQELDISNNDLTGTFPAEIVSRLGSKFRYTGNKRLKCEDSGSGVCVKHHQSSLLANIGLIAGSSAGGICLVLVTVLVAIRLWARFQRPKHASRTERDLSDTRLDDMSDSLFGVGARARPFSLDAVKMATQNYSRRLGQGGFGPVYYGLLEDGQEVAVKILSTSSHQGHQEFSNEIELLSVIHHKNLVSLVGYCKEGPELILLYEYMSGGDLRTRLQHVNASSKKTNELTWRTRLEVALGAAAGLEYLHHGCRPRIIHRDVKSSNILLSESLEAKMADFGLSKRGPLTEQLESHVTTNVKGTTGYLDPEYMMSGQLTDKSDVYSFGVVLLEILTGRTPVFVGCDIPLQERGMNIIDWVRRLLHSGNLQAVMDPMVAQSYNVEAAWRTADVALRCVEMHSKDRPDMHEVVRELNQAVDLELGRNVTYAITSSKLLPAQPYALSCPVLRSHSLETEVSLERTSTSSLSQVSAR